MNPMLPINPDVTSVEPLPRHRLLLEFSNGERKIFDVAPYLSQGAFEQLRDPIAFTAAQVVFGSVEWPIGVGLSYDTLYICSSAADERTARTVA